MCGSVYMYEIMWCVKVCVCKRICGVWKCVYVWDYVVYKSVFSASICRSMLVLLVLKAKWRFDKHLCGGACEKAENSSISGLVLFFEHIRVNTLASIMLPSLDMQLSHLQALHSNWLHHPSYICTHTHTHTHMYTHTHAHTHIYPHKLSHIHSRSHTITHTYTLANTHTHAHVLQVGVSESIIMGIPMPTGTGLFKLRHNVGAVGELAQRNLPLFAYWAMYDERRAQRSVYQEMCTRVWIILGLELACHISGEGLGVAESAAVCAPSVSKEFAYRVWAKVGRVQTEHLHFFRV